jgi:hypothetical protein
MKPNKRPGHVEWQSYTRCEPCDKASFGSRKHARAAARNGDLTGESKLREFRCPVNDAYWHIGRLPPVVKEGRLTASEIYREPDR